MSLYGILIINLFKRNRAFVLHKPFKQILMKGYAHALAAFCVSFPLGRIIGVLRKARRICGVVEFLGKLLFKEFFCKRKLFIQTGCF